MTSYSGDATEGDQLRALFDHSCSQQQQNQKKLHLRLRHHTSPSPSWLREANPACVLSQKPCLGSILHF